MAIGVTVRASAGPPHASYTTLAARRWPRHVFAGGNHVVVAVRLCTQTRDVGDPLPARAHRCPECTRPGSQAPRPRQHGWPRRGPLWLAECVRLARATHRQFPCGLHAFHIQAAHPGVVLHGSA